MECFKNIRIYVKALVVMALMPVSCTDEYLEKEYDTSLSEESVFNNTTLTKEYLANLYTFLPDGLGPFSDVQFLNASRD